MFNPLINLPASEQRQVVTSRAALLAPPKALALSKGKTSGGGAASGAFRV